MALRAAVEGVRRWVSGGQVAAHAAASSRVMGGSRRVRLRHFDSERGVSFAEIIVMIGVLGVLSAVLVASLRGVLPGADASSAESNLQMLNRAVLRFNQTNWELVLAQEPGTADEERIFRSLQYRASSNPAPGSPYLSPDLGAVATTDDTTYRAVWNGRMFELQGPGNATPGLDLLRMMEGGNGAQFGEGYQPVGPQ